MIDPLIEWFFERVYFPVRDWIRRVFGPPSGSGKGRIA